MKRLRKFKRVSRRFGIPVLVFVLVVFIGGIAKTKNAEAENTLSGGHIVATSSIYNTKTNTFNIIPKGLNKIESPPNKPNYKLNLSEANSDLIFVLCLKNNLSYEFALSVFHYESKFNPNAVNTNTNHTKDIGIAQLNSNFMNTYREYAVRYCDLPEGVNFNPYNPDHGIRAGIGNLVYLKNYWQQRGVSGSDLLEYITGSYNLGVFGFEQYIRRTGTIEREYSRQIEQRKDKLKTSNTL